MHISPNPECELCVPSPLRLWGWFLARKGLGEACTQRFWCFCLSGVVQPSSLFPGPPHLRIKVTYFEELNTSSAAVHRNEIFAWIGNGSGGPSPCRLLAFCVQCPFGSPQEQNSIPICPLEAWSAEPCLFRGRHLACLPKY